MNPVGEAWCVLRNLLKKKLKSAKGLSVSVRHTVSEQTVADFKLSSHIFTDILLSPPGSLSNFSINSVTWKYRKLANLPLYSITLCVSFVKVFRLPEALAACLQDEDGQNSAVEGDTTLDTSQDTSNL